MSGISRTGSKKNVSASATSQPAPNRKDASKVSHTIGEDKLEVSAEAQQIDELFQSLADVEEVNKSRVESIRRAIKNGEFPVDYPLLARKILELTDELNRDS